MKKKLWTIMLAGALSVSLLTGCGKDAQTTTEKSDTQTEAENEIEQNASSETEAETPAPSEKPDIKPSETPETEPEKPVHKHSYTGKITTEATCAETGVKTFTCDCGDSYTETIPETKHTWNDDEIIKEATCSAKAVKRITCTVCGKTEEKETGEYAEHDWVTTEATGHYEEKVTGYEEKKVCICACGYKAYDNTIWKQHEDACGMNFSLCYEQTPITENVWIEDTPAQTLCQNCGAAK